MSIAAALSFSACTVHSDVDAGSLPPQQKLDASLEGTWATGCRYESGAYQTETISFHGSAFEDNVAQYTSSTCTGTPFVQAKVPGTFTVVRRSFFEEKGYDVDVVMTNSSGAPETHFFVTVVDGGQLYLPSPTSDTLHVRPSYVDRTRAYTKIGG